MDSPPYVFCSAMEQVYCLTDLHDCFSNVALMVKRSRQIRSCEQQSRDSLQRIKAES